ncbi:MAG: hypothetical protein KGI45_04100 [Patescibacteria group bacterium]|nr:hypothetical protein [Patescibacteria group bacterium]MDE1941081.1 hypothetical protein [Patescibacteria group bacterium]MDE1967217.1 hypothetical protein [Patescibacteria group bacterium]
MKPYHYITIVLIIAVAAVLIFMPRSTSEQPAPSLAAQPSGSSGPMNAEPSNTSAPKQSASGYYSGPKPQMLPIYNDMSASSTIVALAQPAANTTVSSPMAVTGQARGTWFFEAVFPIYLTDKDGRILASGQARATSDWQTADFVPFTARLTFARQPTGATGYLILEKDNPSGRASSAAAFERQVTF